jgi:Tol biopolymer transport system component
MPTQRFAIAPPEKTSFNPAFSLSPDGMQLAFVCRNPDGNTSLWLRPLNAVAAIQLPGTEGASFPFWSPDSRTIGFFAGSKLKRIDATGGPTQTLAEASSDPRGGTWTPDGWIIFSPSTTSPLMRISATGGAVSELTKLDTTIGQTSHRWPSVLPDGKNVFYFGRGGLPEVQGIYVTSIESPAPKFIVASPVAGAYADTGGGYLLFVREDTLMAQHFDATKRELSGEATPLVENLLSYPGELGPTAYSAFSAAAGNLVYRTGDQQTTQLSWYDRTGKLLETVTPPGGYHELSLSRDDNKVLFGRNEGAGSQDIYIQDLSRGSATRLTFDPAGDNTSILSPDETYVVFYSNRGGKHGFYRKAANGAGGDELILTDEGGIYPDDWSPDGKYILYERSGGPSTKVDLWVLPLDDSSKPYAYLETPFEEAHATFSPDGRWVAYASNESGRPEIYIQSFPIGGGKWQVSTAGGDQPQWRSDGKELLYVAPDQNLMSASIDSGPTLSVGRPVTLFLTEIVLSGITDDRNNFVPSRDGQRFLVNRLADAGNLQPLILVLNWAGEVKK